jgi:hypothetical protein
MSIARRAVRTLWSSLLVGGFALPASAADKPAPADMLRYRPRQEVQISTPTTEAELAGCKVEVVAGQGGASAWVLRDARGQVLRKFADTKGTRKADTYCYFLDGVEVYREIDTNQSGKPDQYRWFGPGGMRWGVDVNGDGTIDGWRQISPEEVSQEIHRAVATRNIARLQALIIQEPEVKALELPASEVARIRESAGKIASQFRDTIAKAAITTDSRWSHFEAPVPQCIPADAFGGKYDLVRYSNGRILYEQGGKHDWLQTGEMIQVGRAWRITGGPVPGYGGQEVASNIGSDPAPAANDAVKPLIDRLSELDKNQPNNGNADAIVKYNLTRAELLEQIAAAEKDDQAENWIRQIADCYSTAAQSGSVSTVPYAKLVALRDRIAKARPGSALAGYIAFREMSTDYAAKIAKTKPDGIAKLQDEWKDKLKGFVEKYPTADDAADAMLQLGMVNEFGGKDTEAVNWYEMLVTKHPKSPLANKARGSLLRLKSEGQQFQLSASMIKSGAPFNIANLRGKAVVVYYWASWNQQAAADFFKLSTVLKGNAGNVEVVCVNLDNNIADAQAFLQKTPGPEIQLAAQPGGLDGILAQQFGINVLPTTFLLDKQGKVVSHTVQMSSIDDEIKKLLDEK